MWIVLLFEVTPFEYKYCLNNLVADYSEMIKDILVLLREYSAIQVIRRLQNSRIFFFKTSKEIRKAWRTSLTRAKRASLTRLVPDLSFDCSRLLEYAKIRTVLQSK